MKVDQALKGLTGPRGSPGGADVEGPRPPVAMQTALGRAAVYSHRAGILNSFNGRQGTARVQQYDGFTELN